MRANGTIGVTYENGLLRPDSALGFPDHSPLQIEIRRVETTPEAEEAGRQALHEIRQRGSVRLEGWRPRRDELYERG